jgi:hypothetical protein
MVSCDLCGTSPTGADASPIGTDATAKGADTDTDASPKEARAVSGADADGRGEADGTVPLGWVASIEAGRTRTFCATCAREHLRSIEAKLDSDWW